MKKVKAIIERAGDGSYSVYMDADDLSYCLSDDVRGKMCEV